MTDIYQVVEKTISEVFIDYCTKSVVGRAATDYFIHASEMYTACPRRHIIAYQTKVSPRKNELAANSASLGLTFQLGLAIEKILVTALQRTGGLFGRWVCNNCGSSFVGILSGECECGGEYQYNQLVLKSHKGEVGISGSIDALFNVNGKNYIVECKSIGDRSQFQNMYEPLTEHVYAVSTYLHLAALFPEHNIDTDVAFIVYIPKLHTPQPIKIFRIESGTVAYATIRRFLHWIDVWYASMKLPQRICHSDRSLLCLKTCPPAVARICWL